MIKRNIPFFNYPSLFKNQEKELMDALYDVMSRGAYILQKDLQEFEEKIKNYIGVKHVFGVADGTNALILALRACGICPDDEVILPSHTYIATPASVHFTGAKPVLAECGSDHMLDPDDIKHRITDKTKAIMPVQLNGRTCNMDQIEKIANDYGLIIIEDAAQALGSKYKEKYAGTFGKAGTFSLYPAKLLGCFGDGGLVVTNDDEIARQIFLLRDHGRDENGDVITWGTNCRLDNIQASVLNVKMKHFDNALLRRREIASIYQNELNEITDLTLPPGPDENSDHFDVYQNYEIESGQRDSLMNFLEEKGIKTIIQWAGKPVHQFPNLGFHDVSLPRTDEFFNRCFMLPMNTTLHDDDVIYICNAIKEFYKQS